MNISATLQTSNKMIHYLNCRIFFLSYFLLVVSIYACAHVYHMYIHKFLNKFVLEMLFLLYFTTFRGTYSQLWLHDSVT